LKHLYLKYSFTFRKFKKYSLVVSITDNGSDEYEGNNSKNQAKAITAGTDVFARIAIANDAADWFKFTATSSGNYTLSLTHTSATFTFNLYAAGNNTPALVPISTTATTKEYTLVANNTYYISITGGLSYNCYKLTVSSSSFITKSSYQEPIKETTTGLFDVKVSGNPTSTSFIMNVITNSEEKISMRVFDVQGRLIEERQGLQPMEILKVGERYINGMYLAEIRQGKNRKTIRLVKM